MLQKRKKALFITHDVSFYGASRSLQQIIRNLEDTDIDLIVRKRFLGSHDLKALRFFFGDKINVVKEFCLPFDPCYQGKDASKAMLALHKIRWQQNAQNLYTFIKSGKYDYIHINSLVLHPIIKREQPFILHVREILDHPNEAVFRSLMDAHGVIFIDNATKKPFQHLQLRNSLVLNNPFDMRGIDSPHFQEWVGNSFYKDKVVFSIIGNVAPIKGVDISIQAFRNVKTKDALLLIVGKGNDEYLKYCKKLAGEDSRIIFYGEESEIEKIYALSDYIVRCDPQFCVGRTVYEGLYAGCEVMMPGTEDNKNSLYEAEKFMDSITMYPPQDIKALSIIIADKSSVKLKKRKAGTNIATQIKLFSNFVDLIHTSHLGNNSEYTFN